MRNFARRFLEILDSPPRRGARGQSMVELALTAPILFMMVIGTAEIGFLANNYLIVLDAAREGGRFAVLQNPLSWHKNLTTAGGDPLTRDYEHNDCETTKTDPGGSYHVNAKVRDDAAGFTVVAHPAAIGGYASAGNESSSLGFYDSVMCQVVAGLDPLMFNYATDDIVVSVVSYASRCVGWIVANTNPPPDQPACYADPVTQTRPIGNRKLWVTGRYPLTNRKCVSAAGTPGIDSRDPFATPGVTPVFIPLPGKNNNDVRGFIVTGKLIGATNCYGSRFYVDDSFVGDYNIQYRLNSLPAINGVDGTSIQGYAPSGSMVIVELWWSHGQLFNFFPFNLFNDANGKIPFHVWMMFPLTSAEPTPTPGNN